MNKRLCPLDSESFRMPAHSVTETPRWKIALWWIALGAAFSLAGHNDMREAERMEQERQEYADLHRQAEEYRRLQAERERCSEWEARGVRYRWCRMEIAGDS